MSSPPAVTFDTSGTHNISTESNIPLRSCADAPSYSVVGLAASNATLSATPAACCLNRGDEVILINLQGDAGATDTVGHWELLEVAGVSSTTVSFKTSKSRFYGSGASDDCDIGTSAGQQRVMLLRVPQYGAVTVANDDPNTTLTADGWDGFKGGVLAIRASSISLFGVVSMLGKGYVGGDGACGMSGSDRGQQGESIAGLGLSGGSSGAWPLAAAANIGGGGGGCYNDAFDAFPGGGGGYGAAGITITYSGGGSDACDSGDAEGGHVYDGQDLSSGSGKIFLGSGGGGGGDPVICDLIGGAGGGAVIFLISGDLGTATTARVYTDGEYSISGDGTGGGAGGSIYVEATNVSITEPSQPIYARGGNQSGPPPLATGGEGRIHFECSGTCIDADDAIPTPYVTAQ